MGKQAYDVKRPFPGRTMHDAKTLKTTWLALTLTSCLFLLSQRPSHGTWFPLGGDPRPSPGSSEPFDWDNVPTKPYLDYSDCYNGEYKCARLELPMDYWNGSTNATISLAVIKKPALVPITHPQYGGAVLHNPGGPGGSGVEFIRVSGPLIRSVIDSEDGKYFDLISFDPRGIMHSKPTVQCFKDLRLDQVWQTRVMEEGVFSASDAAFGRLWSMGIARGQSCALPLPDGVPDIKKYVSTAYVARDVLEVVERHGEWREKEATRMLSAKKACRGSQSTKVGHAIVEIPESLRYQRGKEKINYWGFSYGTYLGNTFAAMFPDRIDRLVVDGVVDAYDYKKMLWFDNLVDTEKDMDLLYYHCARVGHPTCALANKTGETTADGVKQRMRNIFQHLYHNPLPVISPNPEVITLSDVKNLIFAGLYSPIQSFPFIANIMADIERGDGTALAAILKAYHRYTCPAQPGSGFSIIPIRNKTEGESAAISYDAFMAIACSDGDDQSWMTKAEFKDHATRLARLSPSIGEMWASVRMMCIHYNVRPCHRFEGPWIGNTSHPILEIGNTFDPVTPGRNAKKMATGFEGAGVLIQDSAGHCSLSTPSKCTRAHIRRYFQTGELPPPGTVCEADVMPFGPGPGETQSWDLELMQAKEQSVGVARGLYAAHGGFLGAGLAQLSQNVPWFAEGIASI